MRRNLWLVSVYGLLVLKLLYERANAQALSLFDVQSLVDGTLPLALAAMAQPV